VRTDRFDVLIVGAGPAGSFAGLALASQGARVALLDKAEFPRDKACGDLVGPRGVQLLDDAGVSLSRTVNVGDMLVVGSTGRRVRLPSAAGHTYPGHGMSIGRLILDALLQKAALDAGAVGFTGRADTPLEVDERLDGYRTSNGMDLRADFVIGADGATSHVAATSRLIDESKVLWGFALRAYLDQSVQLPVIALWEPRPWRGFPGYGWIFPTFDGGTNVGLGIGTRASRTMAADSVRMLPAFLDHLRALGFIDRSTPEPARRLGSWLKMGTIGTTPYRGRTLLVGDAAGLVNPLQGEGISQALSSALAAANSILRDPGRAGELYAETLASSHLPYQRIAAAAHSALVGRRFAIAALGRVVTFPRISSALAGGWAIFWNELLDGAPPSRARTVAATATTIGQLMTAHSQTARWFKDVLQPAETNELTTE